MGADFSLPLFDVSLSHHDLDVMLACIEDTHPELAEDVHTWRMLRHLMVLDGKRMFEQVAALGAAIQTVQFDDVDLLARIADRVAWLNHDLAVAPVSIAESRLMQTKAYEPNIERLVIGPNFEWTSVRYLLGVLLGELHRVEGLSIETASKIDRAGTLDLSTGDVELGALARTVDAIARADAGRSFPPAARLPLELELTERQQFAKLRQFLTNCR